MSKTIFEKSAPLGKKGPFCVFEPPLWKLTGNVYAVYLRPGGKRVVDFPLVINELFSLCVTAEALRANID